MNIMNYLLKAVIGALTLIFTLKAGNAIAPTAKVGKAWVGSTSVKGLLFQGGMGIALTFIIGIVSKYVNQAMASVQQTQ